MVPLLSCNQCDFDTENPRAFLNLKERNVHNVQSVNNTSLEGIHDLPDEVFICGECSAKFETYQNCVNHTKTHISKCYKRDFQSENSKELKDHERNEHDFLKCEKKNHDGNCQNFPKNKASVNTVKIPEENQNQIFSCVQCSKTFEREELVKIHICNIKFDLIAEDAASMVNHIRLIHGQPLFCNFCDFQATDRGNLANHTFKCHEDQT